MSTHHLLICACVLAMSCDVAFSAASAPFTRKGRARSILYNLLMLRIFRLSSTVVVKVALLTSTVYFPALHCTAGSPTCQIASCL